MKHELISDLLKEMDTKGKYLVYKHTSPNGKVYIGITSQRSKKRWQNGRGYLNNDYFSKAISKYGWKSFKHEILFDNLSKEEAERKEISLISMYKSNQRKYGYNIENGGNSIGKHSIETNKKIGIANSGKHPSEESRLKMSLAHKGKPSSWKGKHHSAESREKMRIAKLGIQRGPMNEETKKKKSTPVICIETGKVYYGLREAERQTGISFKLISRVCLGKRKRAGNYHWKYVSEVGETITEDTRESIFENDKKHISEETKRKLSIPIRCIETNIIYYGSREAEKQTGISHSNIIQVCKGKVKTAGGYHWEDATKDNIS